jgi:hypothetical protein
VGTKKQKSKQAKDIKLAEATTNVNTALRGAVVDSGYPSNWDDVEQWILRKCESHKGAPFSVNLTQFIARFQNITGESEVKPISPVKPESSIGGTLPGPTRISPRFARSNSDAIKLEELDAPLVDKRTRGRPRKSATPTDGLRQTQQVLTNYFQVQASPSSPTVDPTQFNIS